MASWHMKGLLQTKRKRIFGRSKNDHKHNIKKSGSPSRMLHI